MLSASRSPSSPTPGSKRLRLATVSLTWPAEGSGGSHLGMPQLQPHKVVQHKTQVEPGSCVSTSLTTAAKNLSQRFQQ
jgi:hypothetical protein